MKNPVMPLDGSLKEALIARIDGKTKPIGSLGRLEECALQLGTIQNSLTPAINKPCIVVFAGDHGIARSGVSPYPQEVTRQMVLNYLEGGAAINVFTRINQLELHVVDAGVNGHLEPHPALIDCKVAMGTADMLVAPAMTVDQCNLAMERGARIVADLAEKGCNAIGFGEMGIGNTSSAALLMHVFTGEPLTHCVGRGTGLDDEGLERKRQVLARVLDTHGKPDTPLQTMQTYGGLELAMMCGAMLEAGRQQMVMLIDGFIVTAALLASAAMEPNITDYCIYAHCSDENGHGRMLRSLNAEPLLHLGLRLGEGTGAALAFPLLRAAEAFLGEMASFESAGVDKKTN